MKIAFLTNYYNYHQASFAEYMCKETNNNFYIITTALMDDDHIKMGWNSIDIPDFVLDYSSVPSKCNTIIDTSDVVIIGSAPQKLIKKRLNKHKLTFLYSERIDKEKPSLIKFIKDFPILYYLYGRHSNYYCLCASAYTAKDFAKRLCFKNKCYKWGYFPQTIIYSNDELFKSSSSEKCELLFCARMIDWKHPELALKVAKRLKEEGIPFNLNFVGRGNMDNEIANLIKSWNLSQEVHQCGAVNPEKVREYMLNADIFLFTSDRREGWGAVLNESMNSGCAVIASNEIGSVPFLLKNNVNGYIYQNGDFEELYSKVKDLCINKKKRELFSLEAYKSITEIWNAENAVKRLLLLIDDIKKLGYSERFNDGPCSPAKII